MINVEVREKKGKGLGYSKVEPPFDHNYSSMPRINTSVDDLILKSDRGHEFTTGSNEQVSLTIDPDLTNMNCSDDSKDEDKEEISARKSTDCSVVFNKSKFSIPKIDYVGKFETISIKPSEMIKKFNTIC
ncbi:hypothetical protein R6Q57_009233 [Mikania cordata]